MISAPRLPPASVSSEQGLVGLSRGESGAETYLGWQQGKWGEGMGVPCRTG